ncbi:MAG: phosphatidylserine decarboxylase, partial [Enterococcus sp.]|nr:phosphatidylserine decarboxylase [Enterococcus sp.]
MKIDTQNVKRDAHGTNRMIKFLYETALGRGLLRIMTKPFITRLGGFFFNTRLSSLFISSFIKKNGIDMDDYEDRRFKSYNDFFTRRIKLGKRDIAGDENVLISPADSRITVYKIKTDEKTSEGKFTIKGSEYTLFDFLDDEELADEFDGGYFMIFRLSVDDYHRYCFPAGGRLEFIKKIDGKFHTVNPL